MRSSELWFPSLMAEEEEEEEKLSILLVVSLAEAESKESEVGIVESRDSKIHRLEVVKSRGISWRLSSFEKALMEEEELEPVDCSLGEMKLRRRQQPFCRFLV
ncbi:hypothetical protein LXL04_014697 [Taraxacum kok-saghyz]